MIRCRMKGPGGATVIFLGLTPRDLTDLADAPIPIEGESIGLGPNVMIAIMVGESGQDIIREIEANMKTPFPKDEKTGAYIPVND